jgi:putative Mn2+ efflux pump MntP
VGIVETVVIGLALSMDAFAVTLSNACAFPYATGTQRLAMPLVFGLFQGLMPLIGYLIGSFAASFIDQYAGLIAFVILGIIGGRMVRGGLRAVRETRAQQALTPHDEVCPAPPAPVPAGDGSLSTPVPVPVSPVPPLAPLAATGASSYLSCGALLAQGVATSIDALIVGVSLLALGANIAIAAPLIALTTFICCVVALVLGKRFGVLLGDKAEVVGGIVLILIGIKALF